MMLEQLLQTMTRQARALGWNDREWALAADLRPETLSRVRRREGKCDAGTLAALARACDLELVVRERGPANPVDATGLFPQRLDRALEERLLELCASGDVDAGHWRAAGPSFFMGGLAAMLSCADDLDPDGRYARLAEALHPGVLRIETFRFWLRTSPVKPSRFLPMLRRLRGRSEPAWRVPLSMHSPAQRAPQ